MVLVLILMTLCLSVFLLGIFFQLAKFEKRMADAATLVETYMVKRYNLNRIKPPE